VPSFFKELADIEAKGIKDARDRIYVSDRCHINFDLHAAVDGLEEVELGANAIGTTKRGIGPCYSSKAARSGIRLAEMFNAGLFERKLRQLAAGYKKRYGDLLQYDVEEEITRFKQYRLALADHVIDAVAFMKDAQEREANILVEGSQALMLDIDYGTYPYVTSSNTCLGARVGPRAQTKKYQGGNRGRQGVSNPEISTTCSLCNRYPENGVTNSRQIHHQGWFRKFPDRGYWRGWNETAAAGRRNWRVHGPQTKSKQLPGSVDLTEALALPRCVIFPAI
jgi:hypothetical protein